MMSPRILGAILTVAAVSLLSVGRLFVQIADFYPTAPSPDGVTDFDARFAPLRAMLPAKGVIGYMTDADTPASDTNAQAEYHLAQYALAPVLVVRSSEQRFVVGNFHRAVTTGSLRDRGFKLVREFGNGIALLENEKVR
ncbi:MAG: hypothetical protein JNM66_05705 [Bryobacterales bacterium]|nr:hypothetical protein [Bryobacterales bacterium]